jgi:quinol monooxygenase YgiN
MISRMRFLISLFLTVALLGSAAGVQTEAQAPVDTAVYAVSYVDVMPSGRGVAAAAFKSYRDASRNDGGFVRLDLLEQVGRPGHFAIIETWTDQKALDAHANAAHSKRLQDVLQPVRLSGYDQRPYKTLAVGSRPAGANGQTIYVVTHVDTIPGPQTDGPGLLKRLAEASRMEQGNVRFDVLQHSMRANHFTIIEAWQSQNALDMHAAAAHTRQYRDALQPMSGGPLDERLYKAAE